MDPVLEVTRRARARYAANPTGKVYIGYVDGECYVCAVGAIWAEQLTCQADISTVVSGRPPWQIVEELPEAERDALRLLDVAAVELVPESERSRDDEDVRLGPLEWVNQDYWPDGMRFGEVPLSQLGEKLWEARKEMVLRIYDLVIARREAAARTDEILGEVVREADRRLVVA